MMTVSPPIRSPRRVAAIVTVAALTLGAIIAPTSVAVAADAVVPAPSAHYDMTHSGTALTDVSGNGRDAALTGFGASSFLSLADGDVLRFRNDGYASLPKNLVTATDNDFSVEMTVSARTAAATMGWVIGDGVGPWNTTTLGNHIFMTPYSNQGGYSNQVLAAIRVKGADNGESRMPAGGALAAGFSTVTLTSTGNTLRLYRDGNPISTLTHDKSLSSIIPSGSVLGYLGRSLYQGDALLTADVADVKFWDVSLSADEVAASQPSSAQKAALSGDLLETDILRTLLASNASADAVTTNLSFPATVNGTPLTWSSSNTAVVAATGAVTRQTEDAAAVVTATSSTRAYTYSITVKAKSVAEIEASVQADLDAIVLKSRTTENLPLAATGRVNGSAISWTSSKPALVTPTAADYANPAVGAADPFRGAGAVTRAPYGNGDETVTLTATASVGGVEKSKTFTITIAEKTRVAPDAGYAAAYFKADNDERIYQAATTGNDFFTFTNVNGGAATITSTTDTRGLRDPYILRSHDGDKYYMIATDLCIGTTSNGCSTDWGSSQSAGSLKVEVWESTDLVHWARTNGTNAGIPVNQPAAGMTWAPEAYWDDALQSYVVFFSSRLYSDASHSNGDNLQARVFSVLTRDFTTFTYPPTLWQDTGKARIDSTITKIGDYYYRFTKNEEGNAADGLGAGKDIFLERSKVLTAVTTVSSSTTDPDTGWQLVDYNMTTPKTGQAGEGPEIVRLNAGDPSNTTGDGYVFLVDNYGSGGYVPFVTTATAIAASRADARLSTTPGWVARSKSGLPASPRHGAFVSVPKAVLTAVRGWTTVAAVESTTTLTLSGRQATASVAAADLGDVAGSVVFTSGAWTATARIVDGAASVDLPSSVTGTLTAKYDGYTDGLVAKSDATTAVPDNTFVVGQPLVAGTVKVGSTLTANPGTWTPVPTTISYRWLRDGAPISRATSATYLLAAADRGHRISVRVTGASEGYTTAAAESAATAKVAAGTLKASTPKVSGTAKVGKKLAAKSGTWKPSGVSLSYRWYRSGKAIGGATSSKYTVKSADAGKKITVRVTGKKSGYTTVAKTSKSTTTVKR